MNTFCTKKFLAVCILTLSGTLLHEKSNAQTLINSIGSTFSENFNTLTKAGTWTNGTTPLNNWYAIGYNGKTPFVPLTFNLNDGNNTLGALCSFGSLNNSDRALGHVPSGNNGNISYVGWRLKNNMSSTTITSLDITWTLEQWKAVTTNAQKISLHYQKSINAITSIDINNLINTGLFVVCPKQNGTGAAINGNLDANRVTVTHTINNLNIAPGSEIMICWGTAKFSSNQLMAIDDISIIAKTNQTIEFPPIPTKTFGDIPFAINATASSNLNVSYTSSISDVATISGNTVTINGPGKTEITANQAGNTFYSSAPEQKQTISINPLSPITKAASSINQTSFTANWDANNGLRDATTNYVIEYSTDKEFNDFAYIDATQKSQSINNLTPNSIYYYRLYSINDNLFSDYSEASAITTGSNYITVNAGNWDVGSNWDVGNIKNIANSIKIQHDINLTSARDSIVTNTLWITSTGKLTTNQRIHVTNQLIIEVDANGNSGQILNTANINVGHNATIIVRRAFSGGKWAFVGFPFEVKAANIFAAGTSTPLTWGDQDSGTDYIVMEYDGDKRDKTGLINNITSGLNWVNVPSRILIAKKGYNIYTATNRTIDFTLRGENKGDIFSINGTTCSLDMHTTNAFPGHHSWNLITLPQVSAFDLALSPNNAPYYTFNGINYDVVLGGEELIVSPFQSFFLQASYTTMNFANSGRRLKAKAVDNENDIADDIYLNLSNGTKLYDDITRIRFKNGASTKYVIGEDAGKSFGNDPNLSYIYSVTNNVNYAINTLPRSVTAVELQTKFARTGNYSIDIKSIEKVKNYSAVLLLDRLTSRYTELIEARTYAFTVNAANNEVSRFKVILVPNETSAISTPSSNGIRIISENRKATVMGISGTATLQIIDLGGKIIFDGKINDGEFVNIPQKGLYLFRISVDDQSTVLKTFIQ